MVVVVVAAAVDAAVMDEASPLQRPAVGGGACLARELRLHGGAQDEPLLLVKKHHVIPCRSAPKASDRLITAWRLHYWHSRLDLIQYGWPSKYWKNAIVYIILFEDLSRLQLGSLRLV